MIAENAAAKSNAKTPNPASQCRATRLRNLAVLRRGCFRFSYIRAADYALFNARFRVGPFCARDLGRKITGVALLQIGALPIFAG